MNEPTTPNSPFRRYRRDDRRFAAATGIGVLAMLLGAAWILSTWTRRPWFDVLYHAPLAFVVVAGLVDAWFARRDRPVRGFLLLSLFAAAYTTGRVVHDWPCSGHALIGVLFAVAAPRKFWRVAGCVIAAQAAATKWIAGERPESALYGAALGAVIGFVALRIDRERPRPKALA
jgi:hypothetical protein